MTSSTPAYTPETLDAYLDGLLEEEALSTFENRLEQNPKLRKQVDQQRLIDEALKRMHAEGDVLENAMNRVAEAVDAMAGCTPDRAESPVKRFRISLPQGLSIAAILTLGVLSIWNVAEQLPSLLSPGQPKSSAYEGKPWRNMATVYAETVAAGFEPGWVCNTDEVFSATFQRQLGQGILLSTMPAGVTASGLSYTNTITDRTICLLARVEGKPVMVFIDRIDQDSDHRGADRLLPADSDLNLFSRELGALILHELTPLAEPKLLDSFLDSGNAKK